MNVISNNTHTNFIMKYSINDFFYCAFVKNFLKFAPKNLFINSSFQVVHIRVCKLKVISFKNWCTSLPLMSIQHIDPTSGEIYLLCSSVFVTKIAKKKICSHSKFAQVKYEHTSVCVVIMQWISPKDIIIQWGIM